MATKKLSKKSAPAKRTTTSTSTKKARRPAAAPKKAVTPRGKTPAGKPPRRRWTTKAAPEPRGRHGAVPPTALPKAKRAPRGAPAPTPAKAPAKAPPPVVTRPAAAAVAAPAKADEARPTALAIAQAGLDKKAEDVTVFDVRGLTSYADYFVVMTADSDRQASAIADGIEQLMKDQGKTKVGVEGYEGGRWILVDYGDVVAHVMNRESRGFYDLEGLWADAPRFIVQD
jgi:ribosome-associated protein